RTAGCIGTSGRAGRVRAGELQVLRDDPNCPRRTGEVRSVRGDVDRAAGRSVALDDDALDGQRDRAREILVGFRFDDPARLPVAAEESLVAGSVETGPLAA